MVNQDEKNNKKNRGKILKGMVVKIIDDKTVSVEVLNTSRNPLYKRTIKRKKLYLAHVAQGEFEIGESIEIMESRPISKKKKWIAVNKNKKKSK